MPSKSIKKGGSPASSAVMKLVDTPIRVDGMMVIPLMKGGSGASSSVMSIVQPVCGCEANLPEMVGKMAGTVTDFYKATGGSKKKSMKQRGKRGSMKKTMKKGGSIPYYINMQNVCNDCGGLRIIPAFPSGKMAGGAKKNMKGGSAWLAVHNSRSAMQMPEGQFKAFTTTENYVAGGQNPKCIFNGPMFG
jgi:hypothetical protein